MALALERPVVIPLVGGSDAELARWLAPRLEAAEVKADEEELERWEAIAEVRHHVAEGETTVVHGPAFTRPGALESLCAAVLDAGGICVPFYIEPPREQGDSAGSKGDGYQDLQFQTAYFSEGLPTVIGVRLDGSRSIEENGEQLLRLFY